MSGTAGFGAGRGRSAGCRADRARLMTSRMLGVLALALQRELVAVADQHDVALVEGLERGAMADRDYGGCRQFLLEQTIQRRLGGLIQRRGRLVEEQILRPMQQRARESEALLFAERKHSVPVRFLLEPRRELRHAHRDEGVADLIRTERAGFRRIDNRSL